MTSTVQCPLCNAPQMLRSRIRGPIERLMCLAGGYYRCRLCQERSFVFGRRVHKPAVDQASK